MIADLDPDQRAAVTAPSRLVAVVAGAGSGKTRVLTRRVAHRIATGDADARHTLVLTFTREAAGELRRRLRALGLREHVEAGTFHSVMLGVLRQRWADTDRRPRAVVDDRRRLVRDALGGNAPRGAVESAVGEIEWAGARGITSTHYSALGRRAGRRPHGGLDRAAEAIEAYTTLKRRRGIIDFDDVLSLTLDECGRDPEFGDVLRWRFRHLLVDEAQDLNPVQHRLVDVLRDGRDDLFLVGDPDQAIYGFNGADPTVLTEVESTFPGIEIVRLPVNHRCTPQIVDAGVHVLRCSGDEPLLRSARADGPVVTVSTADDEHDEAALVATTIARRDPELVRSGQVAVLARTNAQLTAFDHALADAGVTVRRRVTAQGSALQTSIRRAAERSSPSQLRAWAHDTLDDLEPLEIARSKLADVEQRRTAPAGSTRARRPPAGATGAARADVAAVEADRRVATAALEFLRDRPRGTGADFRSWVATSDPFHDASADGVELLSFHAAKGREWHTVFVTGVETSLVPHKSATTAATRAEEARLLYVACTRATDVLTITCARRRRGYARRTSPYVADLDPAQPEHRPPPRELVRRAASATPTAHLRAWRDDAARRAMVLPTQLVSDRDLAAIAAARPVDAESLAEVTSMGIITARRLAPGIVRALHGGPDPGLRPGGE